jgi:hypothetical protein
MSEFAIRANLAAPEPALISAACCVFTSLPDITDDGFFKLDRASPAAIGFLNLIDKLERLFHKPVILDQRPREFIPECGQYQGDAGNHPPIA